jgi:DNA-binding response OmpR family regulator
LKNRILIIDDEVAICDVFTAYLKTEGFEVESAHEGETGANLAVSGEFFLILLDIDLPGIDGFEVLSRIRSGSSVPVILMSGTHLEEADRIVGLTAGADYFLCKPFNLAELVARIRAVGRRTHQESPEPSVVGDVELNTGTRTTTCADKQVKLTSAEFRLLEVFVRSAGSVLNRE